MKYIKYLVVFFILCSCEGYHYISSPHFVPLNEKKGEIKANVSTNACQLSYSVSNNISLFADIDFNKKSYNSNLIGGPEHHGIEYTDYEVNDNNFGISYYKSTDKFSYEVLLGAGKGQYKYYNNIDSLFSNSIRINANKLNFYIQPDIGYNVVDGNMIGKLGIFTRFYNTYLYDINSYIFRSYNSNLYPDHEYLVDKKTLNLSFIEPGILLRLGWKYFKFQSTISYTFSLNNKLIEYKEFNVFLGVFIDINVFKSKE